MSANQINSDITPILQILAAALAEDIYEATNSVHLREEVKPGAVQLVDPRPEGHEPDLCAA